MEKKSVYIIACQSGGGDKADKFTPIFLKFKKIVQSEFEKIYSNEVNILSIVFRVDGKFSNWGEKGINRMRLKKKLDRITIDIGITEDVLDLSEKEIWDFVWQEFEKATQSMLDKLIKAKIEFNFEEFNEDFSSFKNKNFKDI